MSSPFSDRPATAADHAVWVRFFAELGVDDPPPPLDVWMADIAPRTRMLEADGRVVGCGFSQVIERVGYVSHLVVDPGERRRGAGRFLMLRMAESFRALGCAEWALRVKPDNEPALRLYRSLGLSPQHLSTVFRLAWSDAARLPREEGAFTLRAIAPEEDAAIEASFRVLPGMLAIQRARPGRVLLQLVEARPSGEACVGIVCFDPNFAQTRMFRMARPALSPWLLDAMRPHTKPGDRSVGVMAEDDDAVAEAIRAAGGEVRFEALLLRGPLPAA